MIRKPKPQKEKPGPGQESVWDYPRPPRLERCSKPIRIVLGGETIVRSERGWRVLETSHPPVYYLPLKDFKPNVLILTGHTSFCEYKGRAHYLNVQVNNLTREHAAWTYLDPVPLFAPIRAHIAVYAHQMDQCFVGDQPVIPQAGDFYGGWITDEIVGPFKGQPETWGW